MKSLFCIILLSVPMTLYSQIYGTTNEGKKIKLNSDGTWEYLQVESNTTYETSYIFIGGKKLTSGIPEVIHNGVDKFSSEVVTSISIAKEETKTLIIFWQEKESDFSFSTWKGNTTIYLENNKTITLLDRGLTGLNKVDRTKIYGSILETIKVQQIYAAYYLTPNECKLLKESSISRIGYRLNELFGDNATIFLDVQSNSSTVMNQLKAIGR